MKKKNLILLLACVLFVMSLTIYATSADYSETVPTLGDKTVATGTKSYRGWIYATHNLYSTSNAAKVKCWVDMQRPDGSWVQQTKRLETLKGSSSTLYYYSEPYVGTTLSFRIGADYAEGGNSIKGNINFY